ncbi:hypothetical protein [Streptomyces natalensis]|uniref:Tetratricopeptide repeat protein n=1 Tax=Streptomyces natalensis ATCC 27448 TaxID=1240678 RepID=A0A0D7CPG8_9ACTN|nr:hypothetical protein [Streptomyces natalensis]KIZ17735.1 hypothetical protein SNA_12135 [Streptomyces natalensis ATCC 27448]
MSPPPPPLGRPRRKDAPVLTPGLDDTQLAASVTALTHGRWGEVRTLIAETGTDWDLRGHRVTVLGAVPGCASWARDWQLAEPDSGDAATLLAGAAVQRALAGKDSLHAAATACRTAARMLPDDPTPWLGALLLARHTGTVDEREQAFDQIRARHPDHHHAHHLMTACLAELQQGDRDDPLHQVYDFAAWAAEQAPADSPLAVLPVIAHAERHRVLAAHGLQPDAAGHWSTRRARQAMKAAFDWWLEWEGEGHPRSKVDLNFLAHAKFHEGRMAEAAALFHRIGTHVTPEPWSYTGRDALKAFKAARATAFAAT